MIYVILIAAYLLLVALAFGFSLQIDEDVKYETNVHCAFAFIVGWLIIPFAIVWLIGVVIAEKYKENKKLI